MKFIALSLLALASVPSAVFGSTSYSPPGPTCNPALITCPIAQLTTCDLPLGGNTEFGPILGESGCSFATDVTGVDVTCSGCNLKGGVEDRTTRGCEITPGSGGPLGGGGRPGTLDNVTRDVTFVTIVFMIGGADIPCTYCVEVIPEDVCAIRNTYWPDGGDRRLNGKPALRAIKKKIRQIKRAGICPKIAPDFDADDIADFCAGPQPTYTVGTKEEEVTEVVPATMVLSAAP